MYLFVPYASADVASPPASPDFSQSTLILPVVSLANVAQLAADLLMHSLDLGSVGCLRSKYHIPVISPRDYVQEASTSASGSASIGACVEVFQSKDATITLIQQRAPVIKSRKDEFAKALAAFIREARFKRVLLLAGTDAGLRQDEVGPSPFRYLTTAGSSLVEGLKSTMTPFLPSSPSISSENIPTIPSSGIARKLLAALLDVDSGADVSGITMTVAEGDNRYDSHVFARCVGKVLGLQVGEEKWREPISWKVGLYGRELRADGEGSSSGPAELYG